MHLSVPLTATVLTTTLFTPTILNPTLFTPTILNPTLFKTDFFYLPPGADFTPNPQLIYDWYDVTHSTDANFAFELAVNICAVFSVL